MTVAIDLVDPAISAAPLGQVAALVAAAREKGEQERADAHAEYVLHRGWQAEDAEERAAKYWGSRFAVGEQAPPVLAWRGWPLPAANADQASNERYEHPDAPIAIAHLGGAVFLRHQRTEQRLYDGGRYYTDRDGRMFVITPCVCGLVRESQVDDVLGLGEVLEQAAGRTDGWHGDCEPSRPMPRDFDEEDAAAGPEQAATVLFPEADGFVKALRQFADLLEQRPELPAPGSISVSFYDWDDRCHSTVFLPEVAELQAAEQDVAAWATVLEAEPVTRDNSADSEKSHSVQVEADLAPVGQHVTVYVAVRRDSVSGDAEG